MKSNQQIILMIHTILVRMGLNQYNCALSVPHSLLLSVSVMIVCKFIIISILKLFAIRRVELSNDHIVDDDVPIMTAIMCLL